MEKCDCKLAGKYIDPKIFLSIANHTLRRDILHNLYSMTVEKPITKTELAARMKLDYNALVYQLNNQLRTFWVVKSTEKVRGAHNEYIAPPDCNTIFVYMGDGAVIWHMDPLANLFGKLKVTGTRCRLCNSEQLKKCLGEQDQIELCIRKSADSKKQALLLRNNCREPYTPVDYMLTCTVISELEQEPCTMTFTNCGCFFMDRIKKDNATKKHTCDKKAGCCVTGK
jgi:hypothetical protein